MARIDNFSGVIQNEEMANSRFYYSFALFTLIFALAHLFVYWSMTRTLAYPELKTVVALVFLFFVVLMMTSFFAQGTGKFTMPRTLKYLGYVWMGVYFLFFSVAVFFEAARVFFRVPVQSSWVLVVSGLLVTWSLYQGYQFPKVKRKIVKSEKIPKEFHGKTIVQLTDLHLGHLFLDDVFVTELVDQVNKLEPDIVVITGDMVENSFAKVKPLLAILAGIKPKLGKYYVTGNHEYYYGGAIWETEMARLGWRVLHNEFEVLSIGDARINIAGLPDLSSQSYEPKNGFNPQLLFSRLPTSDYTIVLCHQPRALERLPMQRLDLFLAGHTHGGQIFPFHLLVKTREPFLNGLYEETGRWIHVSPGTGFWGPPMRLGSKSEISLLELRNPSFG